MKTKWLVLMTFVLLALIPTASARADGIIVPEPPICGDVPCFPPERPIPMDQLVIRYHRVTVTIEDQIATTHVDQVFFNPNEWTIEGTYLFPLPLDAAVSGFELWIDGEPVEGEILEAEQARRTYEKIVRKLVDPALLEYAGQGAVRARIFPIPPGGERRIELTYTQALAADIGLVRYQYPLNTEKFSLQPLEAVRISVDVRSTVPLRSAYSPSHAVDVSWESKYHIRAGYEASDVLPDTDFVLYYSLGEEQAMHLITYRDPDDPQNKAGYFLLLLAPRPDADVGALPKDVLLVLDRSGSMEGEKFVQAQEAARFILRNLNPEDRFNLVTFSTSVEVFASRLQPVSALKEALAWIDRQAALGSTDINRALLEAVGMADQERPTYLIFLTDGLPTEGVTDSQQILDNLAAAAPGNLRLFAFGVGYDVDTFLLDSLASAHHGASTYVLPDEPLDEVLSAFYEKISTPVLIDLALDFGTLRAYDMYPTPLPDLFVGSQMVLVGRYRQGGTTTVTLSGRVGDRLETFRFPGQVFAEDSRGQGGAPAMLPRLWATRKIGYLLNQIRLQGPDPETVDQIVRLSIRYGIVTPYTSYLVTEEMPLGAAQQERIAGRQFEDLQQGAGVPTYGQDAVEQAATEGELAEAEAPPAPAEIGQDVIRVVGARTFVLSSGTWIDTAFDPQTMQTQKVAFLSDDYFALVAADPGLAAAFALGERVIAFSSGVAYEVVAADVETGPVQLPPNLPASPPPPQPASPTTTPMPEATPGPILLEAPAETPDTIPCLGGLLPLLLLPVGGLAVRVKDRS